METHQLEWKETWRDEYRGGLQCIYDDHLTIANDCRLPEGTTLSGLINAHKSVSINPLVASAIFRSGQIEAWGRGLERIIKLCVDDNLPEPEFIITPRTFTIYFHIRNNNIEKDGNGDVNDTINSGVNDGINENTPKDFGINDTINDTVNKILKLLNDNKNMTAKKIAEELNITEITVKRNLNILKQKGLIQRVGARKNGYWLVITKS